MFPAYQPPLVGMSHLTTLPHHDLANYDFPFLFRFFPLRHSHFALILYFTSTLLISSTRIQSTFSTFLPLSLLPVHFFHRYYLPVNHVSDHTSFIYFFTALLSFASHSSQSPLSISTSLP